MRRSTPKKRRIKRTHKRRGAIAVLVALLIVPLLGIIAFAVDYGYLLTSRTALQRTADAAVLAAVRDLIPGPDGTQHFDDVRARIREYVAENLADAQLVTTTTTTTTTTIGGSGEETTSSLSGFQVLDSDIEIGRYDPETIYSDHVTMLNDGVADCVRVTLRRDAVANGPVGLFFSRVLGIGDAEINVVATAVLQKASKMVAGADVLPFTVPMTTWDTLETGDTLSIYSSGGMKDQYGNTIPGNWGTVDIGTSNNSTNDLNGQILNGLKQSDLNVLYNSGRIQQTEYLDSMHSTWLNADTGLSAGLRSSVEAVSGEIRLIPLYGDMAASGGENLEIEVIGWGVVYVQDSVWQGNNNTYINVEKAYTYSDKLRAQPDLSNTGDVIDGAYTEPVLVE